MIMLKIQLIRKNEKGIALLFTLIMLSLLLILAMSFALDSMFAQKAAYNSASSSSAAFLGQAQLKQVLLLMEKGQANFDSDGRLYSHDFNNYVSIDMLKERLPYSSLLLKTDKCLDPAVKVNWNYTRSGANTTDPIIGRTAFVVVPVEKIALNSLISKDVDESGGATTGVYNEKRIGKNVSEINIRNAMYKMDAGDDTSTYTITPEMADIFNWKIGEPDVNISRAAGKFTGYWSSYSSVFSILDLESKITDSTNRAKFEENFENTFELDPQYTKEAFWVDLSDDKKIDAADPTATSYELFKRFDLTRADWTTSEEEASFYVKSILLLTKSSTATAPDDDMDKWADEDSLDDTSDVNYTTKYSRGLPWLACFGYDKDGNEDSNLAGTFSSVFDRRCQIAANLKDYSDTDNIPSSDEKPSDWVSGDAPKFTGNERTPYINKIGLKVHVKLEVNGPSGTFSLYTTTASAYVKPYVGCINIYGPAYTQDLQVVVKGYVKVEVSFNGGTPKEMTLNINEAPRPIDKVANWGLAYPGHSTFVEGFAGNVESTDTIDSPAVTAVVNVTNVTITKVVLYYEDGTDKIGYDYVKNLVYNPSFPALTSSTADEQDSWFGFEVNDPRQNLNPGDWVTLQPHQAPLASSTLAVTDANECKPNNLNTHSPITGNIEEPNFGPDPEPVTDSANGALSTAFIRNAPMESPWELGFIHRGAKWETINLKKYDSKKAINKIIINGKDYIPGGGVYTDGDANILDQVKMTKLAKTPEKINISAQEERIINTLFSQVQLGCSIVRDNTNNPVDSAVHMTIASMAATGTSIDTYSPSVDYTTMVTQIMSWFATPDATKTRASVAAKLTLPVGATTDAAQEELIGKIINLTKVNQSGGSSFNIIVLSQAIKDVGTSSGISITKSSMDGSTTATKPLCKIGEFDADTSDSNSDKHVYFDEITGEKKILVKANNGGDKIKVTSFKYIE